MSEVLEYLNDLEAWTSLTALIQMGVAVLIFLGVFIALPDGLTNRITSRDNLGILMATAGLVILGSFVVIPILSLGRQILLWLVFGLALLFGAVKWRRRKGVRS